MKTIKKIFFVALIGSLAGFSSGCRQEDGGNKVCYKNSCFDVELAVTSEGRKRGLQSRESLSAGQGMLFVFADTGRHSFWMKDTLISLDIIWLDYDLRIVHIEERVPPCKADPCEVYTPERAGLYVLELVAGQAAQMGLRLNNKMEFKLNNVNCFSALLKLRVGVI